MIRRALLPLAAMLFVVACNTGLLKKPAVTSPAPPPPTTPSAPATTAPAPATAPQAPAAPAPTPAAPATAGTPTAPAAIPPKSGTQPPAPAAPLRPEVSAAEEQRLAETTRQSIGDLARILGELEGRQMKPPQQEAVRTAKNFLDQARSALDQRDYQRAANLVAKARALTDDVAGATK